MKHAELHTWTLEYCKETMGGRFIDLFYEIKLFKEQWPNADVKAPLDHKDGRAIVTIAYADKLTAEAAALQFQQTVARHDWWKEL